MRDRYEIGVVCTVGVGPERGGRSVNEDNYLICQNGNVRFRVGDAEQVEAVPGDGLLVAVADGMGGHDQVHMASGAAVRALTHLFRAGGPREPESTIRQFLISAHARLHARAMARGPVNLGTTVTIAWLLDGVLWWASVGDSRLYLLRGDALAVVTRDHTRAEFARRDGRPTPREPGALSQAFLYGSRGLGDDRSIRVDPGLDTGKITLLQGDRVLLCSDVVYGHLKVEELRRGLMDASGAVNAASALVETALDNGSDDNATALVLLVEELGRAGGGEPLKDIQTLVPEE